MSDIPKPVSIIHSQCGEEAFKYSGDTSDGSPIYLENVSDYHPDYKPDTHSPIMCKSCDQEVSLFDLHPWPEL